MILFVCLLVCSCFVAASLMRSVGLWWRERNRSSREKDLCGGTLEILLVTSFYWVQKFNTKRWDMWYCGGV